MTKRALISVTDKTGVVEFAKGLVDLGFSILSTGGTYRVITEGGVPAQEVAEYTSFPEMMDGRVKTLHPRIHGGLLALRDNHDHTEAMDVHGIDPIDVLAVNLYRFRETVRKPGVTREEVVENIDIGGPSMIRSAAKNHQSVAVVVDPSDYSAVLEELRAGNGTASVAFSRRLAGKAYAHTAAYDRAIAAWFDCERAEGEGEPHFGDFLGVGGEKVLDLRYGENPHQAAALYVDRDVVGPSLATAEKLSGKDLSYNNLLDLDAALSLALEFDQPSCAIIKHTNPCGTAIAETAADAFEAALASDPLSAYGGIVALNRPIDVQTAEVMKTKGTFVEAIVAPMVEPAALEILKSAKWGKNVRVLSLGGMPEAHPSLAIRAISGGSLVQTADVPDQELPNLVTATKREPSDSEGRALAFAWLVCKHIKSNAIVFARETGDGAFATVGVGAGQMSRVDSVEIAVKKSGENAKGAVLASDAFFPFADGMQAALDAGVSAVIQPGGSKRDDEVVAAADAAGAAMVLTGKRHFLH